MLAAAACLLVGGVLTLGEPPQESNAKPGTAPPKPKAFLVCMGVSDYQSARWNLQFGADDADAMVRELTPRLTAAGYDVVPRAAIVSRTAGATDATKGAFKAALGDVARDAWPDDLVLVSFSGHGYTDAQNELYLFPSEVGACLVPGEKPSAEVLKDSISGADLATWLRRIDAGEMVW